MIKQLIFAVVLFFSLGLSAQDVVLDMNVDEQYTEKKGPNMRQYGHFYEGIAVVVPYNSVSGAKTDLGRSGEFLFGYRYKLKLLSFYAIGFDLNHRWTRYGIASEELPAVATNPLSFAKDVRRMSLGVSSFGAEAYNRINIGKRGNTLGNYLDLGIKGEWNYSRKLYIKENAVDGDYFETSRSVQKKLNFIEKFSTLVTARVGINKVMLYGTYRISDLIAGGYTTPELPPLNMGVQLAF